MDVLRLYWRALALLSAEKWLAIVLAAANVALAMVALAEPILLGRVVDAISHGQTALSLIGMWAGVGLFGIVAGVIVSTFADRMAHRRRLALLGEAFEQALTLPPAYHAERGAGAVASTINWGTESLFWLWLKALREQLVAAVSILFLVPTAISMDPRMALILGLLTAAYFGLNTLAIAKTTVGQRKVEDIRYDVSSRIVDTVGNVTVVQSFARFNAETAELRRMTDKLLSAQYPVLSWWAILIVLQRSAATITMVAVFSVGALLASRGEMTVGEIVAFVGFASLLISRLDTVSSFVTGLHSGAPTLRDFFGLMDARPAIEDKQDAKPLVVKAAEVRYEAVSFRYPGTEHGVTDIGFVVKPGKTLAIVGPTGSGKSTTVSLLQRLRAPEAGRILVDGQDVSDVTLASLRSQIAVVFQEAHLFNRSIADNIRVGRPGATDAEVERAARLAEAHDFIAAKPGGYGFVIGERGASLSGGERQRVAIARAILKDAPILILDEATSALDAETESKIKKALDALRKDRTTFIIAHRLSTVANADEIVVVDQGRIVERGTFRSLVADGGLFARLVAAGGFSIPKQDDDEADAAPGTREDAVLQAAE